MAVGVSAGRGSGTSTASPATADAEWILANALYRFLLTGPLPAAAACTASLRGHREDVARRIALAAMADREDLVDVADPLLLDAASGMTRTAPVTSSGGAHPWRRGSLGYRDLLDGGSGPTNQS